jgi:hypothetical protein
MEMHEHYSFEKLVFKNLKELTIVEINIYFLRTFLRLNDKLPLERLAFIKFIDVEKIRMLFSCS